MRYGLARLAQVAVAITLTALAGCSTSRTDGDQSARSAPAGGPPATAVAGQAWVNPKDGSTLVYIPAGEFKMGSEKGETDEKPVHAVYLDACWIGKIPVTVAQYRRFCEATGHSMPHEPTWGWKDTHPIINVGWGDAVAYCDWAGLCLPTEAEWEKAARGTDGRTYPWGSEWSPVRAVCSVAPAEAEGTEPAGARTAGASPYGCLDMAGNVAQWCADWYDAEYYADSPRNNPTGPTTGDFRLLRSAAWEANVSDFYRAANRSYDPTLMLNGVGFRVALRPRTH